MKNSDEEAIRLVEMLSIDSDNAAKYKKIVANDNKIPMFELNGNFYFDRRQSEKPLISEYDDRRVSKSLEIIADKNQYFFDIYQNMDPSLH